jgi:hypothetical protein
MVLPPEAAAHGLAPGGVQAWRVFCGVGEILVCWTADKEASGDVADHEAAAG